MHNIQISDKRPEIYDRLREKFVDDVDWDKGTIITYLPFVHCKLRLSPAKIIHESVHLRQQEAYAGKAAAWYDDYISSPQFRLEQEIEAYASEADFVKETVKDRNLRHRMIWDMAAQLASPLYGGIISHDRAFKFIK